MKTIVQIALLVIATAAITACGKDVDLTCDDVRAYQLAVPGKRVEAPEGLDDLDASKEVPLPKASPREQRPEGSNCIDRPPEVKLGN